MEKITDLKSLKSFFKEYINTPIFGVAVYAFDRLGPEEFVSDYKLLALRHSFDSSLIGKDHEILSLEKGMGTKHIKAPRNSTTVISHEKTKQFLSNYKNPALLVYKSSSKMEKICRQKIV